MMQRRLLVLGMLALALGSCSSDPPARADYMLQWYPRQGTDYGDLVPGFKSLEMCRIAGARKSLSLAWGRGQMTVDGSRMVYTGDSQPWFECLSDCRPLREGSGTLVCKHVVPYQDEAAFYPQL